MSLLRFDLCLSCFCFFFRKRKKHFAYLHRKSSKKQNKKIAFFMPNLLSFVTLSVAILKACVLVHCAVPPFVGMLALSVFPEGRISNMPNASNFKLLH